jgi:hypothetical protein
MIKNPHEEDVNELFLSETKEQETKEKYFKALRENDDLNDMISKVNH